MNYKLGMVWRGVIAAAIVIMFGAIVTTRPAQAGACYPQPSEQGLAKVTYCPNEAGSTSVDVRAAYGTPLRMERGPVAFDPANPFPADPVVFDGPTTSDWVTSVRTTDATARWQIVYNDPADPRYGQVYDQGTVRVMYPAPAPAAPTFDYDELRVWAPVSEFTNYSLAIGTAEPVAFTDWMSVPCGVSLTVRATPTDRYYYPDYTVRQWDRTLPCPGQMTLSSPKIKRIKVAYKDGGGKPAIELAVQGARVTKKVVWSNDSATVYELQFYGTTVRCPLVNVTAYFPVSGVVTGSQKVCRR